MRNLKANGAVFWAVRGAMAVAEDRDVGRAVDRAVAEAVDDVVGWAVGWAVYWAVNRALDDPGRPALQDFLCKIETQT
jgi:hypothetical protein